MSDIEPITREEMFYNKILGHSEEIEPITRQEIFLDKIANGGLIQKFTITGTTTATGTIVNHDYDDYLMLFGSYVIEGSAYIILRRGDKCYCIYRVTTNGLEPLANETITFDIYCVKGA